MNKRMVKLALLPLLFLIACLFAGIYGAVHNQISYTVSPEYFTQFKFHQFRISESIPDRIGAAIVGWNAAWWMGIVIGMILIPFGLLIRGSANYFWAMIRVFGVVAVTTLIVGLTALAIAFVVVDTEVAGEISRYGNEMTDDVAFARAGTMHNFSYLGGLVGIITGGVAVFWQRRRLNTSSSNVNTNADATEPSGEREPPMARDVKS
jgi:MFS family permease